MVCDLSEPGPVPDLLHVKDTDVKVEQKMIITPVLTETATKTNLDCAIDKAQVSS